jgi:hypothetical protein
MPEKAMHCVPSVTLYGTDHLAWPCCLLCVCALRGVVLLVGVLGSGLQPFCGLLLSVTGKAEGPLGVWLYLWSVCFG